MTLDSILRKGRAMNMQKILETQEIIDCLYTGKRKKIASLLHSEIVWVHENAWRWYKGREEVIHFLENIHIPVCQVIHQKYVARYYNERCVAVIGTYRTFSEAANDEIRRYVITVTWLLEKEKWCLTQCHLSENKDKRGIWNFHDSRMNQYYIPFDKVMWIEASTPTNYVHTFDNTYPVYEKIKDIKEKLPDYFLEIHRGIIVNCIYVIQLQRYCIKIIDGTELPVPEKKYCYVKEQFKQILSE